jgi:AraC-like DNA-binding protein
VSSPELVQSYRERLPAVQVADVVASVWTMEVEAGEGAYEHRTVPNGSVELTYVAGSEGVVVNGPQRLPTVERLAAGSTLVGLRFHPGVASSIFGPPAPELVGVSVDVDRLWGRGAASLAERLAEAGSPTAITRMLEDEVALRAAEHVGPDPLVAAVVDRLQPWVPEPVGERTADLFVSPRHLRRRFVAALGFGPKAFQKIRRFQGFLALAQGRQGERVSLLRLALLAGYSDQAHLTRDSAELTGLSPRAFLEEMWRSCGDNHDHDASYAGLRRALIAAR